MSYLYLTIYKLEKEKETCSCELCEHIDLLSAGRSAFTLVWSEFTLQLLQFSKKTFKATFQVNLALKCGLTCRNDVKLECDLSKIVFPSKVKKKMIKKKRVHNKPPCVQYT